MSNPRIAGASRRANVLFYRWAAIRDCLQNVGLGYLLCQWKVNYYYEAGQELRVLEFLTDREIDDIMWGSMMIHSGKRHIHRPLAEAAINILHQDPGYLSSHDLCHWQYPREGGPYGRLDRPHGDRQDQLANQEADGRTIILSGKIGLTTRGCLALVNRQTAERMIRVLEIGMRCPNLILDPLRTVRWRRLVAERIVRLIPHEGITP